MLFQGITTSQVLVHPAWLAIVQLPLCKSLRLRTCAFSSQSGNIIGVPVAMLSSWPSAPPGSKRHTEKVIHAWVSAARGFRHLVHACVRSEDLPESDHCSSDHCSRDQYPI